MTALVVTPPPSLPTAPDPIDPALCRAIDSCVSRLDGIGPNCFGQPVTVAAEDAPSPALIQALATRVAALDVWLAKSIDGETVLAEVHRLFSGLVPRAGEAETIAARIASYVVVLAGLPGFALFAAVDQFVSGARGDRVHVPTPAELLAAAAAIAQPYRDQRHRIRLVLSAQIRPPRPSAELRARQAAAARRAFHIPEPVSGEPVSANSPDLPSETGALGPLGREILRRSRPRPPAVPDPGSAATDGGP